jgi:hypothetical protein
MQAICMLGSMLSASHCHVTGAGGGSGGGSGGGTDLVYIIGLNWLE